MKLDKVKTDSSELDSSKDDSSKVTEVKKTKKVSNATQLIFNMEQVSKIPETNTSSDPRLSILTDNNPASFVDKL